MAKEGIFLLPSTRLKTYVKKIATSSITSSRSRIRTITKMGVLSRLLIRISAKLEQWTQALNPSQGRSWLSIRRSLGVLNWLSTVADQTDLLCNEQFRRNPESFGIAIL